MSSKQVAVLKREKQLLENLLEMAECETDLVETGRAEDLEILLSMRSDPMSELAAIEAILEIDSQFEDDSATGLETLEEVHSLNLAILRLADRIVNLDERAEILAEELEDCTLPDSSI